MCAICGKGPVDTSRILYLCEECGSDLEYAEFMVDHWHTDYRQFGTTVIVGSLESEVNLL